MQCTGVYFLKGVLKKSGYFTDRLTVSVDTHTAVSFLCFFCCCVVFLLTPYNEHITRKRQLS